MTIVWEVEFCNVDTQLKQYAANVYEYVTSLPIEAKFWILRIYNRVTLTDLLKKYCNHENQTVNENMLRRNHLQIYPKPK